ncbi:DUF488 domain-containing protein [Brevibacterium sp.]|uniref:DUF488 domain-containing protein n=1 Tax=Brevibacterium sp. TaxID=1701 RepID=UPI002811C6BB|nr:DUF488 domain-containing protein [Brevibacterium sp.]
MAESASAFFTIGHSNRSIEEFIELLRESDIDLVVDVRRLPGSKKYPQFNEDSLAQSLTEADIGLRRAQGLTGRRNVSKEIPFEVNAWWKNRSFHNYADHALSDEFRASLDELRTWGESARPAVMCSEAVWWRCHRRLIADNLLARELSVEHILGKGQVKPAELSAGAVIDDDGSVTYPPTEDQED